MDLSWISELLGSNTFRDDVIWAVGIIVVSIAGHFAFKRWAIRFIKVALQRTRNVWDDVLVEKGVFDSVAYLAPTVIVYYGVAHFPSITGGVRKLVIIYVVINLVLLIRKFFATALTIYDTYEVSKKRPIKGYFQVVTLVVYIIGGIFIISLALDRSPWGLLTGLGALTAVLLLIFRDTILSFIASIQLAFNDMVRVGDWIEMPKYGADGDVVDMALHTIKVQNWDKTIVTIPTHKLIEDSFKNWRGMSECGGRRIMRSIHLDQRSIKFLTEEELDALEKIELLAPYLKQRRAEIEEHNREREIDTKVPVNGRRLTNIGVFRQYVVAFLRSNPNVHKELIFLIRQLAPTPEGLPIQVYVFTNDTAWGNYEAIQADIFDHLLASVPHFQLALFQSPSSNDLAALAASRAASPKGA
jgi:miniconductance mechanosensitive channel